MSATSQATLLQRTCSAELDSAVSLYNNGNARAAKFALEQIATTCAHLPQVHHNLGVLEAEQKNWPTAVQHFEQAIVDDRRTNTTLSHLQNIHQYQATVAYQTALGIRKKIKPPELHMQNSAHTNTSFSIPAKTTLHNTPTVDYELYSWWSAAAQNDTPAWLEHYTHGYPPLNRDDASRVDWDDVKRDISFTAQDAVVILKYHNADTEKRTLLLLRLENNRWKIYREALL